MNKLVLIPSAKRVLPELEAEFGAIPSALIPLDSRPALRYIADRYARQGYKAAVAVHEEAELIHAYLANQEDCKVTAYEVGETNSLAQTVLSALAGQPVLPDRLVINFGDTLVEDDLPDSDVICYSNQTEARRWTAFVTDEHGSILAATDKGLEKFNDTPIAVFVGVFVFREPARFLEILKNCVTTKTLLDLDPFYSAVMMYHNAGPADRMLHEVQQWRDFGHLDTYYATKRAMFMNCRYFNQVRIDAERGILRKSSSHREKLANEASWYGKLPPGLQHIAPRVFSCHSTPEQVSLELEFYSYPALNDLYLFGRLELGVWRRVLTSIGNVMTQLQRYHPAQADHRQLQEAMYEMYEQKTRERLQPILDDPAFARFSADEVKINGQICLGLPALLRDLPRTIRNVSLYDHDYFTIVHGDLCLSNILYDLRNGIVRLIDPRGQFGSFDIYGDPRYDLAKLCHSFEGDYDFLNSGMVRSSWLGDHFRYAVFSDARHHRIQRMFHAWALEKWGPWYQQAKLIESLLFLSMVPLHSDRFQAQQVFLAKGLEIYASVLRNGESLIEAAAS